jgi:cysteine synthase B
MADLNNTMTHPDPHALDRFSLDYYVGNTPLVRLQRLASHTAATVYAKLEGNNPAGSVKDRPAYNMIMQAERRGEIKPGDTLIEATSGNTGIALAMVAAMRGYHMILIMPDNMSQERKDAMAAYGAELIEVPAKTAGMEGARDLALQMQGEGKGMVLNQFGNSDNSEAHYLTTGPELWQQTNGKITHFVSSMGTTGTIMGVAKYLKEKNPDIQIIGLQPSEGAAIAGIRRWTKEYRKNHAAIGTAGRDFCRRIVRWCGMGCYSGGRKHFSGATGCGDCLHYLRPWRPLFIDGSVFGTGLMALINLVLAC